MCVNLLSIGTVGHGVVRLDEKHNLVRDYSLD